MKHPILLLALLVSMGARLLQAAPAENVILVTADGLRWQEVFRGAEDISWEKAFGNQGNSNAVRKEFLRSTPGLSRAALMPFLWETVASKGQIWGNRDRGSEVRVTNGRNFSYPGYNEFLTGKPDPRIDSNDKVLNPNTNVFEWLQGRPGFGGRVAAAINWDVLPWILNTPRSRIPVWSGFDVPDGTERLPVPSALTEIVERGRTPWTGVLLDTYVAYAAKHTLRTLRPRAMYVSFGETDDWAHEGHYERYLRAIREFDRFLGELWALVQSMPEYRDKTALLVSVDHGRGPTPVAWKSHGKEIAESASIWFAAMGPGVAPLGERSNTPPAVQAQVAATVAALVGHDFASAIPETRPPFPILEAAPKP
jgi:hypothetical protein